MTQTNLNTATDELRQLAGDTAKLHEVSLVEILIYAATYELLKLGLSTDEAAKAFAEARANLVKAGMKEKK